MNTTKPFTISKALVMKAFKLVKANDGVAGVDQQSIESFEEDLKDNLYKLWNRLSSGSYFPAAVKAVAIPKKGGGERILGIPTVSDSSDDIYNHFKDIGAYKDNMPIKEMDLVQDKWLHNNYDAWDVSYLSDDYTTNLIGDDTEIH